MDPGDGPLHPHRFSPVVYGDEVVTELPKTVKYWLENPPVDGPHYYRRLDIDGGSSSRTVQVVIEDVGSPHEAAARDSWPPVIRVFVSADDDGTGCERRCWAEPVATQEDREATSHELMHALQFLVHWTDTGKTTMRFS